MMRRLAYSDKHIPGLRPRKSYTGRARSKRPQPPAKSYTPTSPGYVLLNAEIETKISSDFILPEQYFRPGYSSQQSGAERLCVAISEEALHCVLLARHSQDKAAHRLAQEAREWIESDEDRHVFSFLSICAVLKYNEDIVRAAVLREDWAGFARSEQAEKKLRLT